MMVLSDLFSYFAVADGFISKDASTPLVVVVPGLTSDSSAAVSFYLIFLMLTYFCIVFAYLKSSLYFCCITYFYIC